MLEILLMCYFWVSDSRNKFVLCKVQTFLQRIKIYHTFLFRKEFEDHKNTELLIVKVSDFPQEKKSWSCNNIPKAEQRLEEALKKQRQIIAKFKSKDKKGVSSIYIIDEHWDTEKLFSLIVLEITLPWFHLKPTFKFLALALTLRNGYSFRTLEAILMESKSLLGKK